RSISMKNLLFAILAVSAFCLILASCGKSNDKPAPLSIPPDSTTTTKIPPDSAGMAVADSIIGKLVVVEDTLSNTNNYFLDEGGTPYFPIPGNYIGGTSDFYNFQSGGAYTASENGLTGAG